jgi:hypothetical protein
LPSADPAIALAEASRVLALPLPTFTGPGIDAVYQAEFALLQTSRIVPVVHIPVVYFVSPAITNWKLRPDGTWDSSSLWLEQGQP